MDCLKLIAIDSDDIEIISAHVQDAVVKATDIHWRPLEKRVVIGLNRFDWEGANGLDHQFRRRRSALRFERVASCKCRNVTAADKDRTLNLLAIAFEASDAPAGVVMLTFSGGAELRLEVECLEAELADLGPAWATDNRPVHALDADAGEVSKQG